MTSKYLLLSCLAVFVFSVAATPVEEIKNSVEEAKHVEGVKEVAVQDVNQVQDQPQLLQAADRIDENFSAVGNEDVGVKTEKEDLETANTFWGGFYRSPSWGWRRGWGYGGYSPYYRSYGWGGRGYNNGWGWGWGNGYNRGWNSGYYWR